MSYKRKLRERLQKARERHWKGASIAGSKYNKIRLFTAAIMMLAFAVYFVWSMSLMP